MAEEKPNERFIRNLYESNPIKLPTGKVGIFQIEWAPDGSDAHGCTLVFEKELTLEDLVALKEIQAVRDLSARSTLTSASLKTPKLPPIDLSNNSFLDTTRKGLHRAYFPRTEDPEETARRNQPSRRLPNGGDIKVYGATFERNSKGRKKVLEAEFSTGKPTYLEAAEAIFILLADKQLADEQLANKQQANSSSSNSSSSSQAGSETLTLRISFKNRLGELDQEEYQVEVGPDKPPFDYGRLNAAFGGFVTPNWAVNRSRNDQTLGALIRRYEPSLLLLKLVAEKAVKQQAGAESMYFSRTATEALTKGPGQTGVLRPDDLSVNPVTVLDFFLNQLKQDKAAHSISMCGFFQQIVGPGFFKNFANTVGSVGQVSDSIMSSVKEFDETLQALYEKGGLSPGLGGDKPPAKNNRIPEIMAGEDYKALIDRVGIINRRKKEGSPTYESDLLKMQGILAIEDAFEKARLEPDKGKALQMIKTAIQANQEDVSAYSGDLSKGFFSFFHRDTKDVGSFFTHGYNSTSDKLLNGLLAEIKLAETPAAAPAPGNTSNGPSG